MKVTGEFMILSTCQLTLRWLLLVSGCRYFLNFSCFNATGIFVGLTINNHHFQNKCNVGYAFINMINPENIVPFFKVRFCTISRTCHVGFSLFYNKKNCALASFSCLHFLCFFIWAFIKLLVNF